MYEIIGCRIDFSLFTFHFSTIMINFASEFIKAAFGTQCP